MNMIDGTKKAGKPKMGNASPILERKKAPKWFTDIPDTFDTPHSNDDHIFALKFLEDTMLSFSITVNIEYAVTVLEEATRS